MDEVFPHPLRLPVQPEPPRERPKKRHLQTPAIVDELRTRFPDFVRAFEPDGLSPEEFDTFGPTARTLRAFTGSYHDLLHQVADALVPNPDVRPAS